MYSCFRGEMARFGVDWYDCKCVVFTSAIGVQSMGFRRSVAKWIGHTETFYFKSCFSSFLETEKLVLGII